MTRKQDRSPAMRMLAGRVPDAVYRKAHQLALDTDKPVQTLLAEAVEVLAARYAARGEARA